MKKIRISGLAKFALVVGCILLTAAFTEQGDSMDINDKAIVTTIAVDKKDGEIWLYLEYANIQQGQAGSSGSGGGGGGGAKKFSLVKGHGKTLAEARQDVDLQLDKPVFISEARALILTEAFAEERLLEYLYRLRADETYRKKVVSMTTRDSLDALFKAVNDRNESLGYSAENTVTTLEEDGFCFTRTTSRLLENLSNVYTGILMPCIGLVEGETALTGYSVVNDTRVIGFIPIEECNGLNILKTDMAKTLYVLPYKGIQFTVEVDLTDRKVKTYYDNGKPAFKYSLKFDAFLEYGDKKTPYSFTDADNEELTSMVKQMIERDVYDAFNQAQRTYKTDYLQLDDAFRVTFPEIAETLDWNVAFEQATIVADVEVSLMSTSMIDYSVDVSR